MKNLIVFLFSMSFLGTVVFAQDNDNKTDYRDKLMIGFKGGANYSNVYDTKGDVFVADPKLGVVIGVFGSIPIGKLYGIAPEVLFSQKGFKATGQILGSAYGLTRTSNFIDVPIMFAVKPSEFITLVAGPQFSYLLNQKDVFTSGNTTVEQQKEFQNANIRKNLLSIVVGGNVTMKHLVLGGRLAWDLQNNNGDGTSTAPRYKNRWIQLTVGYRLYN